MQSATPSSTTSVFRSAGWLSWWEERGAGTLQEPSGQLDILSAAVEVGEAPTSAAALASRTVKDRIIGEVSSPKCSCAELSGAKNDLMKLLDSHHINPITSLGYMERRMGKGSPGTSQYRHSSTPSLRIVVQKLKECSVYLSWKYIYCSIPEATEHGYVNIKEQVASGYHYDLDDMDIFWLQALNEDLAALTDSEEENDIVFSDKYNISVCPLGRLFAAYLGVSPLPSNPYYIIRLHPGPVTLT
ncbi:hypothetical protein QTO34_016784 [Cnephaeus nilssonii]|uniref:Uncharacterized protein n=1 Tax=Cnephaeus nilssonii TaxID=3371016 RepID=A0AA40LQ07_CNENI|nr:hypothetical protein QTO34_016784 [Eptesicus nilssonii]